MKIMNPWPLFALALCMTGPITTGAADADRPVTWDEIVQRLMLADTPGTVFESVIRPLLDRPAHLEAFFEGTETDEAGRPRQVFRHVSGQWSFVCYSDAESAPAAPGWRGAVTGLLVELQARGRDEEGRRCYMLRLRRAGTARFLP